METGEEAIVQRILSMIERTDRFEGEIRDALRNDPSALVDAAIQRLRSFIDDRRTLDAYLRSRGGRRVLGRERMRIELDERHAPAELVQSTLDALPQEADRALSLLQAERKERSRAQAGRFLVSRGFEEDAVEAALDKFFASE